MEELKIYISAFAFTILATLKMAFPGVAEDMRAGTLDLLSNDRNCIEVIETMGRKISENGITQELIEAFGFKEEEKKEAMKVNDKTETEEETQDEQTDIIILDTEN